MNCASPLFLSSYHTHFQHAKTLAPVPLAELRQMTACVLVELHVVISKATLFVSQCAIDQLFELLNVERFESKNLGARNECAVYIKEQIVSRRTDQPQIATLNIRQKDVLLRLVEMVDLINKQDRPLPRCAEPIGGGSDDAAHFGHIAFDAADSNEFCVCHLCNDASQG